MAPPSSRRLFAAASLAAAIFGARALAGCTSAAGHAIVDLVVATSYRPPILPADAPPPASSSSPYLLLAGDLHCHVAPPDWPPHVIRGLEETAALADQEGLDFVILTPHVWARFFEDDALRSKVLAGNAALARAILALPPGRASFIPGIEYTDGQFGHVGVSFGDLEAVLAGLPAAEARLHPDAFFERYVASGGMLIVNHPFTTPRNVVVSISKEDLSWRPFTGRGPFPVEIEAVGRLAHGFEAWNLTTAELRDRFLYLDRAHSADLTLARVDREILERRRPLFTVGGSDSHSHSLRATTFVLSTGRAPAQLREAFMAGRTCVRAPAACSLEARAAGSGAAWVTVGAKLHDVARVELRANGDHVAVLRNGAPVGETKRGGLVTVETPAGQCSVLRAVVDEGYSAPIYANCPF